ncbi:helix-turn-helix transcriptional regulator [Catenuloplanes indicus]|uniref:DNA-binding CsgD family transcriptional regulator n=1 Tax=Catenuloplanes indicus TaxID=137267 RepID=A0AAE3VVG3_9ACTN|nr:LuxR family transcriptional regulator [Catenuloplanes indicus]MDQ0364993.1 DNA-binding CsgD family transcriptional regulator [Catenuloplanes indicus]
MSAAEPAPMIGREREIAVISTALSQLTVGSARVITVTGDPGLGKTRLLEEATRLAGVHGHPVLAGRVPYGSRGPADPLSDALHDYRYGIDRAESPRDLLARIAAPGLVLILDDIDRADPAAVVELLRLLRRPPQAPVLMLMAYRPRQVAAWLHQYVTGGSHPRAVDWLPLAPLDGDEAARLVAADPLLSWRPALHSDSGGNPRYLQVLAGQGTGIAPGTWALSGELADLSPAAQLAASAAAVLGDPFALAVVGAVAELTGPELHAAIDELARQDLVRPVEADGRFVFRHPVVGTVAYAAAAPAWRLAAHARAALALRAIGTSPDAMAHHVERSAAVGDREAIALLVAAARADGETMTPTRSRWLRAALRLLPADSQAPRPATLMVALAAALAAEGRLAESRVTLHRAWPAAVAHHSRTYDLVAGLGAIVEWLLCRGAEGRALLDRAAGATSGASTAVRPTRSLALAVIDLADGSLDGCRRWSADALTGAEHSGDRALAGVGHGLMLVADCLDARADDAAPRLDALAAMVDGLVDSELAGNLGATGLLGLGEMMFGRPVDALRHLDRALTVAHASGTLLAVPHLQAGRAFVLRALGRLTEATVAAAEAVELATTSGSDEQLVLALAARCCVATWTGDRDGALRAGAAATGWRARRPSRWVTALAHRMYAEARLAGGGREGSRTLTDALGGADLPELDRWSRPYTYELLTRMELADDSRADAMEWAIRAGGTVTASGPPQRAGMAELAIAEALAAEEPVTAQCHAATAARLLDASGLRLDAARAWLAGGVAAASGGDPQQAAAQLRRAQAVFDAAGAHGWSRYAVAERRRLAGRAPRTGTAAPRSGLDTLTSRERQVAMLVSEGLTNRRVAQRLHVTEKTVETHLSRIFAKLCVGSRVEMARVCLDPTSRTS